MVAGVSPAAKAEAEREASEREHAEEEARRELEHSRQLLVQNEKLANLGAMISGLGHEIANPISTTVMSLEELNEDTGALKNDIDSLMDESGKDQAFQDNINGQFEVIGETLGYIDQATNRLCALFSALLSNFIHLCYTKLLSGAHTTMSH